MAPRTRIPPELTVRPFSLEEARKAGLSRESLRGNVWRRLGRGLYTLAARPDDPLKLLEGWMQMLPADAVFTGFTAAWLHGLDVDTLRRAEVAVPRGSWARSRAGLVVRDVREPDWVVVRGLRAANVVRTLANISLRLSEVETLVAMDAALKAGLTDRAGLMRCRRTRHLAAVAEPAESPMETRLRWLLLQNGLPTPEVQPELHDTQGSFVARADLFYRAPRLVIEYDGGNHRDRLVEDNRRQNALFDAGFQVLRFTASDIYTQPARVVALVKGALKAAA